MFLTHREQAATHICTFYSIIIIIIIIIKNNDSKLNFL